MKICDFLFLFLWGCIKIKNEFVCQYVFDMFFLYKMYIDDKVRSEIKEINIRMSGGRHI